MTDNLRSLTKDAISFLDEKDKNLESLKVPQGSGKSVLGIQMGLRDADISNDLNAFELNCPFFVEGRGDCYIKTRANGVYHKFNKNFKCDYSGELKKDEIDKCLLVHDVGKLFECKTCVFANEETGRCLRDGLGLRPNGCGDYVQQTKEIFKIEVKGLTRNQELKTTIDAILETMSVDRLRKGLLLMRK